MKIVRVRLGKRQLSIGLLLFLILYRVGLDYIYQQIISPHYRYAGLFDASTAELKLISWGMLLVSFFFTKKIVTNNEEKLSYELLWFLYLLAFVPFTTMTGCGVFDTRFILCNSLYWLFLFFFCNALWKKGKRISIKEKRNKVSSSAVFQGIALLSVLVILYVSGRYAGFRIILDLDDVYDYRAEAKLNSLPTILVYLFSWTRLLNIVLIAFFIQKKKIIWVVLLVVAQVLSFGYNGMKATLFATVLVIVLSMFTQLQIKSFNYWLLILLIALEIICILQYRIFRGYSLSSLFLRRSMFLPVQISSFYVDFFSNNTPDFFRASFLRFVGFKTPYPNLAKIIAGIYLNRPNMNSNNGLISDAFTNFGSAGIIIMPFLLSLLFHVMDSLTRDLDLSVLAPITFVLASSFINSFVLTILLTHGLGVVLLLFYFVNSDKELHQRIRQ